ncbi:MAG: HAMP domain-containing histidine kinase [Oscillospiraceae bacterium]|nr:HAMP domain-containing histidine kinase [Oscillospiraceae bacterium]
MKNVTKKFMSRYFGQSLDLRIRLFNVLVSVSSLFCAIIAIVSIFTDAGLIGMALSLAASVGCFVLLIFASRSGHARLCHIIFIVGAFFILFPTLFFRMGGYHGGLPAFLVFAIVFTIFMLEGRMALLVTALELILYLGIYVFAYINPESVSLFPTERGVLASNIQDLIIVSVALGATMYAQVSLYRAQQRQLDAQNAVLAQANRAKTQFLANASHEMRSPLTVISVNVQTVTNILADMGEAVKDATADKLLKNAQNEIMRLSRMVSGMLTLASISENTEKSKTDLSTLLRSTADSMHLILTKRRNELETEIDGELIIFGDADLLSQVAVNLIQNSNAYTENDIIKLRAVRDGEIITVTVSDNGSGISSEMLPHVFERGVSNGGTGFGLYFCKTVIESHGGRIWIESEPGKNTAVSFTVPVYEGQFGGDAL